MNESFRIPVFFRDEMIARVESFSPSAGKPRLALDDWQQQGFLIEVTSFEPASPRLLSGADDPHHVEGVLAGKLRRRRVCSATHAPVGPAPVTACRPSTNTRRNQTLALTVSRFYPAGIRQISYPTDR
jgi:hypothetical protein